MKQTIILFLFICSAVFAQAQSKDETRFRLENIVNELDLMIKNHQSDYMDVMRQRKDFEGLKVFQRIPFQDDLKGLQKDLHASTLNYGLELLDFKFSGHSPPPPSVPAEIITDHPFRLLPEQVAETVFCLIKVRGKGRNIDLWSSSLRDQQMRLVEVIDKHLLETPQNETATWLIRLKSYHYRYISFPKLRSRDPYEVLLAERDPLFVKLAQKANFLAPQAARFYENRREFLLNQARLDFFFRKAIPPSEHPHVH